MDGRARRGGAFVAIALVAALTAACGGSELSTFVVAGLRELHESDE